MTDDGEDVEDPLFDRSDDHDRDRDRRRDTERLDPDGRDEDGQADGRPSLRERVTTWVHETGDGLRKRLDGPATAASSGGGRAATALTTTRAKKSYLGIGLLVAAAVAFWAVAQSRGLFAAVVYSILFVMAATAFPVLINLLGGATPNSIGKLHLLLGAVAFDHHYLVQREHGWDWCPGDRGRVWIDGEWHDVSGVENYSVLGWRPFGILRYKDGETWASKRADQAGLNAQPSAKRERDPTADGGSPVVERGGVKEVERPHISGVDGTWLLDLKRVYTNGLRKIGDVELIETAEEIIERNQVQDGRMASAGPVLQTVGGLILGIIAGYGYLFLSG